MDETKLIGERITERTFKITGPEGQVERFTQELARVDSIMLVMRTQGETSEDAGSATFIFGYSARPLLTLLPPIGKPYALWLPQEGD